MLNTWARCAVTGLLILVPAWATFLILAALVRTVNHAVAGLLAQFGISATPVVGLCLFLLLVVGAGAFTTHVLGRHLLTLIETWIDRIPLVRSIYLTLKGMTDLFQFRSRFGHSTVVAFPFPRDGLWALGFVMGQAPAVLQVHPSTQLSMVFVPTAIHPFTGYLALVPDRQLRPLNLPPEDAMKMEFSAGLYKPPAGWLNAPPAS